LTDTMHNLIRKIRFGVVAGVGAVLALAALEVAVSAQQVRSDRLADQNSTTPSVSSSTPAPSGTSTFAPVAPTVPPENPRITPSAGDHGMSFRSGEYSIAAG
jgi:hypothetical protein